MEDKTMIVVGAVILIIVLFVLLIIPTSQRDVLGTLGADSLNFGANTTPATEPTPDVVELQAQDLKVGTGSAEVKQGDTITVHYTGYLMDSTVFDSSVQRNEPFVVTVGAGQVIPGFEQGVIGMKLGGARRIFIPSDMAYGAQGQGAIPPNSDLAFDIELLEIAPPPTEEVEEEPPEDGEENADENADENNDENPEEPTPEP